MAFLVSEKIEFLCLFAIKDEVTGDWRKKFKPERKLFETGRGGLPKYSILTSFVLP